MRNAPSKGVNLNIVEGTNVEGYCRTWHWLFFFADKVDEK